MKTKTLGWVVVSDNGPMALVHKWPYRNVRGGGLRKANPNNRWPVAVFKSRARAQAAINRTLMWHWRQNRLAELGGVWLIVEASNA